VRVYVYFRYGRITARKYINANTPNGTFFFGVPPLSFPSFEFPTDNTTEFGFLCSFICTFWKGEEAIGFTMVSSSLRAKEKNNRFFSGAGGA